MDKQQPTESPAEQTDGTAAVSSDVDVTETPVRRDHVYMIPQIERQVVLIDLINRELNEWMPRDSSAFIEPLWQKSSNKEGRKNE